MATAVYGASEGLDTLVLEGVAVGGQAVASARIENYLGFPSGLAGEELAAKARVRADTFEAEITSPCEVTSLRMADDLVVILSDGREVWGRIELHLSTEVVGVDGGDHLDSIVPENKVTGTRETVACAGLFCFIGAVPATSWLEGSPLPGCLPKPTEQAEAAAPPPVVFDVSSPAGAAMDRCRRRGRTWPRSLHRARPALPLRPRRRRQR